MQLRNARLCLDCEEVHDLAQCPACASETFAFLTRWVTANDKRPPDPLAPANPEELATYRQLLHPSPNANASGWKYVRQGALGLALFGVAGWMWRQHRADNGPGGASEPPTTPAEGSQG